MNKEQVYDEKINPLMAQINDICLEHGIEMIANFFLPTEEKQSLQSTSSLPDEDGKKTIGHILTLRILAPSLCDAIEHQQNEILQ